MLKIIGKDSSINVRKVLWTCAELGLPFEREDWQAGHAALNPNALVPVLVDDGVVLWESNTICRYLCTQYGDGALLPNDAKSRARVEQWMDWQATDLNTAWRYAFMALVRNSPAYQEPAQIAASIAAWNRHLGILDDQLGATGVYALGGSFTLADVVLGLSVNRWMMTPIDKPGYRYVAAYYDRLAERPGFREYGRNGVA
ncbi:glutathione S-transferase family protein [Telluria aromaticivorans]|uniref:Glutathione S-transferase n=1 Tax=Telluria aromaticivorans TaxID=2725995 RepID=A0A7Y2P0B8_9BURK|nr:glutathione S-transferase N-terminal domain-containing protein [Telluria aromaticivorans]NNG24028.1 glutathione S-transferase [Telluria aromaticivorans]